MYLIRLLISSTIYLSFLTTQSSQKQWRTVTSFSKLTPSPPSSCSLQSTKDTWLIVFIDKNYCSRCFQANNHKNISVDCLICLAFL